MSPPQPLAPPPRVSGAPLGASLIARRQGAARAGRAAGGGLSWQTMLADLALIRFMVTAAAMGQSPKPNTAHPGTSTPIRPASAVGEPVAVWRAGAGAPPLARWLAGQQADPRLALTITLRYGPGGQAGALAEAATLAREAGGMGRQARIVVEAAPRDFGPGAGPDAVPGGDAEASLAYDQAAADPAVSGTGSKTGT